MGAFGEDQDRLSVASLSCSPRLPRRSMELLLNPNNCQSHGEEQQEEEGREQEEVMAAAVERRQVEGARQQEEEDELDEIVMEESQKKQGVGTVDDSEDEDYNHDDDDDNGEEDEDFQPAKRRKLPSVSAKDALEPVRVQDSKPDVRRPRRCTLPTFMQIEMDERQSQTQDPKFADKKRHDPPPPSRNPSATESMLAAEYEERPSMASLNVQ